ncbi:hypothetical protein GGS26DRAFT_555059 [Hypomontagnella submonticulosa]|nr:hypothetical protein GGS26DRAFT_555059 [Hypomontagnella submonticulosa]
MDPVTSIGLASSIVQLISFTGSLISKSREIYRSAEGSLVENGELSIIVKTLEAQNRRIAAQAAALRSSSSEPAKHLLQLCDGVRKLTQELISTIEHLKLSSTGGKWASVFQALKSVWKEQDIADLLRRLDRYRQQIDSVLLELLQERLRVFTETAEDKDAKVEQNFSKILASLQPGSQWQRQLVETARQAVQAQAPPNVMQLDNFSALLSAGARDDREKFIKLRMLESLKFADMRDRYERIPEAHQKTFEWVFHESEDGEGDSKRRWDNFATWLMSNNKLYWVTGKPGSGKSTLMKYLSDNARLRSRLKVWRGEKPLYTGRFFFWNSGTALQMSRIGLMQSLLHEIVSQCPDEIPRIFPDRWQYQVYFGYDSRPWSWSEVSGAFKRLVADSSKAFFFMIDGLDEFDGDCAELASFLLKTASTGDNVKLCIASRPWLVFEDAFRHRPSLRVEDLTLKDIEVFASDKLTENVMFSQLQEHDPTNARALIEEVTEKSSGVFLWVRLVIKSLLEGLQDGDTVDDLLARLYLIPRDLEELFQKILGDLDPSYFDQASQIFRTVRASHVPWGEISLEAAPVTVSTATDTSTQSRDDWSPLTLLTLSFIGEDPKRALSMKYGEPMSWEQQCYNAERTRRRLNSRCKGLLEVPQHTEQGPNAKVHYLHRTVKDFLDEDRAQIFLVSGSKNSFDPHIALCSSLIRHTKAICPKEDMEDASSMEIFGDLLRQFVMQCHWLERREQAEYVAFLDEMNKVTETILDNGEQGGYQEWDLPHWTKRVDPYVGISCQVHSLFDYAVIRSLTHYVQAKLAGGYSFATNANKEYLSEQAMKTSQRIAELLEASENGGFATPGTTLYEQSVVEVQTQTPPRPAEHLDVPGNEQRWRHKFKNSWLKRLSLTKS